jgi:hypothetical protein
MCPTAARTLVTTLDCRKLSCHPSCQVNILSSFCIRHRLKVQVMWPRGDTSFSLPFPAFIPVCFCSSCCTQSSRLGPHGKLYTSIPTIWQLACIRHSAVIASETSAATRSWEAPYPLVMVVEQTLGHFHQQLRNPCFTSTGKWRWGYP